MSTTKYMVTITSLPDGSFNANAVPVGDTVPVTPPPTPTPSPTPTPPVTTPMPGAVEMPLVSQNFVDVVPGTPYFIRLPHPFTGDRSIQFGQGRGIAPSHINIAVSDQPGAGFTDVYPNHVEGDPNAGVTIAASLNPQVMRGGTYQAQVTTDRPWYVSFLVTEPGGLVYYSY